MANKKKITQNVNKDKLFNDLPKVRPEISRWLTKSANYQSCNLGDIVPIYFDEVLPKEKRKITLGMISHLTTPVAPFFNAQYTEVRVFFVPMRLCADLLNGYKDRKSPWVKVFGEDNTSTSADIVVSLANQTLPDVSSSFASVISSFNTNHTKADNVLDSLDLLGVSDYQKPNYLNLAAYELIYQRHYRNENYEASTDSALYKTLFNAYNTVNAVSLNAAYTFEKANREKDYFTGAKPFTQKGTALEVNVSGSAPVVCESSSHSMKNWMALGNEDNTVASGGHSLIVYNNSASKNPYAYIHASADVNPDIQNDYLNITRSNLVADMSSVSGISIEDLRILIKTQELLEKDMMYGSMYAESLNAHFGCAPLDLTLQDPQELYRYTITSNMQAIFQTSSTSGEASILGTIGANSTTQTEPFVILPETEFYEHGILMICAVHKLQNVYDTKYFKPKFIYKKGRFEFYTPELNDLGFQEITSDEMRSSSNAKAGFNEAFGEYRYKFNKCHGSLNSSFPYWAPSIANEYTSIAALYKEGVGIIDKALSVNSSTAPQFYDAWGFEEVNTKPMSLHSIPGFDGVI